MIQDDSRLAGLVLTMNDARAVGHCVKGVKAWCEANGFDFRDAMKHGIPASVVAGMDDAFGARIIQRKLGLTDVEQQTEDNR